MFQIDASRYEKVGRDEALSLLEQARMTPDKLTAHRDRTFTARYNKERLSDFESLLYEARLESVDNRVAIFKRPSPRLDRGRYITLQFAVANTETLGINGYSSADHDQPEIGHSAILSQLQGTARDMRQLVHYAHELALKSASHKHLPVALEELQREIDKLNDGLKQLAR